jgi:hypothetical protein
VLDVVTAEFCVGAWKNIAFSVWHGQLKASHIPQIKAVFERVNAASPQGFGAITLVARDAAPIAPDARKPLSSLYEGFGTGLKGVSLVLEAEGVKGMTLRFLINAIQTLIRPSYPIEVHESLETGATWLQGRVGAQNAPEELRALIAEYESRRASAPAN